MNWLDATLVGFLVLGFLLGFRKGFIRSFSGFIGMGLAIWAGINFSNLLDTYVAQYDAIPDSLVSIVSLLVMIFLVYLSLKIVAKILHSVVHTVGLGLLNRLGGALFGGLINLLLVTAFVYYFEPYLPWLVEQESIDQSQCIPHTQALANFLKISMV